MATAASIDAGALEVHARLGPKGLEALHLRNTRPVAVRALEGRSPADVLARVPRLFSLCAMAQTAAARAALDAAGCGQGDTVPTPGRIHDEIVVAAETAQEHLWRLMLDWPALLALPAAQRTEWRTRFTAIYRRLTTMRQEGQGAPDTELSALAHEIAAPLLDAVGGELDPALTTAQATPLLPMLGARACVEQYDFGRAFSRAPELDGAAHETGVLARHAADTETAARLRQGQRIRARIAARIADLRECGQVLSASPRPDRTRIDAFSPTPGAGLACVASARGLLIHRVRVDETTSGPRVIEYSVVAPTEWNFHPRGAFVREALAAPQGTPAALERRLRALALALDPCVAVSWAIEEKLHA